MATLNEMRARAHALALEVFGTISAIALIIDTDGGRYFIGEHAPRSRQNWATRTRLATTATAISIGDFVACAACGAFTVLGAPNTTVVARHGRVISVTATEWDRVISDHERFIVVAISDGRPVHAAYLFATPSCKGCNASDVGKMTYADERASATLARIAVLIRAGLVFEVR